MLQNYNKYNLLKVFLDSPTDSFRLRELGRFASLSPLSVSNYLQEFQKEGLITRYEKRKIPFYCAKRENPDFILYKKLSIIYELHHSGLIDHLWDTLAPEAIVLFGSSARGESTEESDIDIFIVGKEKPLALERFERQLGKEIHLLFSSDLRKISGELRSNVINGIILKGYLRLIEDDAKGISGQGKGKVDT